MHTSKLTAALLLAGLTMACSAVHAAEADAATAPKPAPKTLPPASTKTGLTFAKDIKPLFDASCIKCHGEQRPKAALNLTTLEGTLAGSEDGKVITVGKSDKSSLVTAIARINPKSAMPPEPRAPRGGQGGPGGQKPGGPGNENKPGNPPAATDAHGTNAPAASAPGNANRPPGGPGSGGGRNQGPPPKPLTAEEVGIVRAWIDQGAK